MATFTHSPNEVAATWTHSPNETAATWTYSSGEVAASWLETEMMQFGFLFWEGVTYDWEDTMAYTDTYASSQQTESSGKWEDLG